MLIKLILIAFLYLPTLEREKQKCCKPRHWIF